jgi:hypothetical protein
MKKANSESYQRPELDFLQLLLEFSQLYLLVDAKTDEEQLSYTNEILRQLSLLTPSISFPQHVSPPHSPATDSLLSPVENLISFHRGWEKGNDSADPTPCPYRRYIPPPPPPTLLPPDLSH